ncbi:cuticle protein 67-like [Anabrus simplex]|uniref:cuticle protein 67-like n=1 Tax=Anabrus simplex TaxID=316456 RepID=UPI0035A2DE62
MDFGRGGPHVFFSFQVVILAAVLAVANAGYLGAPAAVGYAAAPAYAASAYAAPAYGHSYATPAITAQQSNILRTPGNLGQISTYSKSINTPYSSVSKSDVRVSNDALAYPAVAHAAPLGYAAPAVHAAPLGYAAPAVHAAPALAAPGLAARAGLLGVAYSAAPAVAHMTYSNGLGLSYAW